MQGPRAVPRGEEGPREEAEEGAEEGGKEAPEGGGRGRGRPEPAGPALGRPAGPGLPLQVGRWPPGCACPAAPPVVWGRNGGAAITSPGASAGGQRCGGGGGELGGGAGGEEKVRGGLPLCGVHCEACHGTAGLEPSRWQVTLFHPLTRTRGPFGSTQGAPRTRQRLARARCKRGGYSPAQESSGAPGHDPPVK